MLSHKKTYLLIFIFSVFCFHISKASTSRLIEINPYSEEENMVSEALVLPYQLINYREKMRDNITMLSNFIKDIDSDFVVMVNGGEDLMHIADIENLIVKYNYLQNKYEEPYEEIANIKFDRFMKYVDVVSAPNALCGDNIKFKNLEKDSIRKVYIEYCDSEEKIDKVIAYSLKENSLLYVVNNLDNLYNKINGEMIISESAKNIFNIKDAQNVLILTNDSGYSDKEKFMEDVRNSNYDIVVINPIFQGIERYSKEDISSLKLKKNGFKRLIVSHLNVSEANKNAYYWDKSWNDIPPTWIKRESLTTKNAFIVEYWDDVWRDIISKYFKSINLLKFDGVWLTGADNYQYFEKINPIN